MLRVIKHSNTIGLTSLGLLLVSRLVLFAIFQEFLALWFNSWIESQKYWVLTATLTNLLSISLLILLTRYEGVSFSSLFRFNPNSRKRDLILFVGLALLAIISVFIPDYLLTKLFWGDATYYQNLLLQPIPKPLAYILLITFPVTIGLAELPTYFGYIMPRLKKNLQVKWLAILLPVLLLSLQHTTLPLVFDLKFILFRGLVFLPLASLIGFAVYKRPSLLPYFIVLHVLMDLGTVVMFIPA